MWNSPTQSHQLHMDSTTELQSEQHKNKQLTELYQKAQEANAQLSQQVCTHTQCSNTNLRGSFLFVLSACVCGR